MCVCVCYCIVSQVPTARLMKGSGAGYFVIAIAHQSVLQII